MKKFIKKLIKNIALFFGLGYSGILFADEFKKWEEEFDPSGSSE